MRRIKTTSHPQAKASKKLQDDPFNVLMVRLANMSKPPRARSGAQQWQKANWITGAMVEAVVLKEWEDATGIVVPPGAFDDDWDMTTVPPGGADDEAEDERDKTAGPSAPALTDDDASEKVSYPTINFIAGVVGRMFKALPQEEQVRWKADAQEEARVEKEVYKARLAEPLSGDATSRAMYVRIASHFVQRS